MADDRPPPGGPAEPPGTLTRLIEEVVRGAADQVEREAESSLRPGLLIGRYELLREVGRGGFGVVWEARDRELGRTVAFKALRVSGEAARERRLLAEAEVAARLSHPNIVTVLDVGRSEHGVYLVQEFLPTSRPVRPGPPPRPATAARAGSSPARCWACSSRRCWACRRPSGCVERPPSAPRPRHPPASAWPVPRPRPTASGGRSSPPTSTTPASGWPGGTASFGARGCARRRASRPGTRARTGSSSSSRSAASGRRSSPWRPASSPRQGAGRWRPDRRRRRPEGAHGRPHRPVRRQQQLPPGRRAVEAPAHLRGGAGVPLRRAPPGPGERRPSQRRPGAASTARRPP